jgi:type IV pilus assembly protein PilA
MVVLLILAILLAIAIPTFLGVTKSANDRAAQSNLNTAFQNSKAAFQQNSQAYPTSANLVTSLTSAEAALSFTTTNSASQSMIAVATSSDSKGVVLAAYSKAGNCWMIVDNTQTISQTTAPYGTSATASGSTTAGAIKLPTAPGTYYVELKGDNTTADCSASAPNLTSGTYQYATTGGFPS